MVKIPRDWFGGLTGRQAAFASIRPAKLGGAPGLGLMKMTVPALLTTAERLMAASMQCEAATLVADQTYRADCVRDFEAASTKLA